MKGDRLFELAFVLFAIFLVSRASGTEAQKIVSPQTRQELIMARNAAWHSFFQSDPASAIKKVIAPDVIAIQENQEKWDDRADLIAEATAMQRSQTTLFRLEFPRTEIQVFGDVAILYYSYIFETGIEGKVHGTDAGRGTEVFVRRDGRWIDVGWHLDNGFRKNPILKTMGPPLSDR